MAKDLDPIATHGWRHRLHEVIFEADTREGRWFDIILIVSILSSVVVIMLESVASVRARHGTLLRGMEWGYTVLFTIEYLLRLLCVRRPTAYARSFFGLVDLFSVLPSYLSVLLPGTQYLIVIRILRILRVFRVLKLVQYWREASTLGRALRASSRKIFVFLYVVVILVVIIGSLMYVIEGERNGFTSIPRSVYWAIVTLTTVGYGDIAPATSIGQTLAALVMILGYGIIAVPTGIVTTEMARESGGRKGISTQSCPFCMAEGHDRDAHFCKYCGGKL